MNFRILAILEFEKLSHGVNYFRGTNSFSRVPDVVSTFPLAFFGTIDDWMQIIEKEWVLMGLVGIWLLGS